MEISIIVLTFNAKEITMKMLASLEKSVAFYENSSKKKCEVLLIDNASKDGVLEEVRKVYADSSFLKIVPNSENLGFSKGNNKALKESSKSSKYILFLNPDIILDEDAIYKVYEFMEEKTKVGLSTCLVNLPSGEIDIDCHRAFPTIWNAFCYFSKLEAGLGKILPQLFGRYHMLWEDFSKPHQIDACLGAFMLVRRSVGEKVSWWSEEYFLNGEDIDLCYKIKKIEGFEIYFLPNSKVVHFKGSSKGTKKVTQKAAKVSDEVKNLQINSGIDAMKIFYQKFYASKNPSFINFLVYLGMALLKKIRLISKNE